MKLFGFLKVFFVSSVLLALSASFAWSAIEVHPSLSVQAEYDDNILLRAKDEAADYRSIIRPALSFVRKKGGGSFVFDYSSNLIYHYKHSEQDTFSHSVSISAKSDPTKKISTALNVTDTYRFFLTDPRQLNQPVLVDDLAEGNTLNITPSLRFRVGSYTTFLFEYKYKNIFYKDSPQSIDSESHGADISWEQKFGSDVVLTLGYGYSTTKFDQPLEEQYTGSNGYADDKCNLKLQWQLSPNIEWVAGYSYTWRKYEDSRTTDFSSWNSSFNFDLFTATSLKLGYNQKYTDDVFGRNYKVRESTVDLSQGIGKKIVLTLGGSYRESAYQLLERESDALKTRIGLKIAVSSKVSLSINGGYETWDSKPADVSRDIYRGQATLGYRLTDWLFLDARYSYLESISNTPTNEYTVNKYAIAARAVF